MASVDDETRQFLNPEFARRLEASGNSTVDIIIEVSDGSVDALLSQLAPLSDVTVREKFITLDRFVPATLPTEAVEQVAALDVVEKIHHDQPASALSDGNFIDAVREFSLQSDPIRDRITSRAVSHFTPDDDLRDVVDIGDPEEIRFNYFQAPLGDPIRVGMSAVQRLTGSNTTGEEFIPTSESVNWILDGNVVSGDDGGNIKLAVLDTGHTPIEPSEGARLGHTVSMVPGEPPIDGHSHGTWCTYTAVGRSAPSFWGRVNGVASGAEYAHFKCLNTFPGFGKTSWILKSMELANEWGADVINMSLGGPLQGPVEEDPYCQLIDDLCKANAGEEEGSIFVVAAGNTGPDRWSIGTPGASPKALTVGSWSITDNEPSDFSSRGPQSGWYQDNPDRYESDLSDYGAFEFVKPDVAAPGGGRANPELTNDRDELLHQATMGWLEGLYDGFKDARGSMKGTSMASPHVAGLVGLLYEAGIVQNALEVKEVVAEREPLPEFQLATQSARESEEGKNLAAGFGRIRESTFSV